MKLVFLFILFFGLPSLFAENYRVVKEGSIHESYVCQECGNLLLEAVPVPPPENINELTPIKIDREMIWIPGYWSWSREHGNYLWTSGIWRRPPPDKHWVEGKWKRTSEGWVWIQGFWSSVALENVNYIDQMPPDPIDENISMPPDSKETYFWVAGYWHYNADQQRYIWNSGHWNVLDTHWIYFPSQYIWREEGYVFNPGYWDWPMNRRGVAFASIFVEPNLIEPIVYEPKEGLSELYVMQLLFPYWPNYSSLFCAHYFFYHDAWVGWGATPGWWNWPTWWGLTWQDLWGLWWWWSHPGYPNPIWLTETDAKKIKPPHNFVIQLMAKIQPPANITPNGAIGQHKLYETLVRISGVTLPILPTDPKQIIQIQEVVNPQSARKILLYPSSKENLVEPPKKPFFGSEEALQSSPQRKIAPLPSSNFLKNPTQGTIPRQNNKRNALRCFSLIGQASYHYYPMYPWTNPQPLYEAPPQGYGLDYRYPQSPMQTQHHGNFMTRPKPQRNPTGPKVHPTPGDYSTLPGL